MSDPLKEMAVFHWVGRLAETPNFVPTEKGGYAVLKLSIKRGNRDWGFNAIAYEDCAQEIAADCERGDTIDIMGECSKTKNKQTGHWENAFTARKLIAWAEGVDTLDAPADEIGFPF